MTVITFRFGFIMGKNSTIQGFQNLWLKPRTGRIKENLYFLFILVESMSIHFRFHKVRMESIFSFNPYVWGHLTMMKKNLYNV